jgi:hypothetical protein
LGTALATTGRTLVYGGGNVGLMGVVADAALAARGKVIGVIPQPMVDKELAHHGLTELHIVGSMHERKALMAELSEGFIAMPGGIGTLEEMFEIWTWAQLGIHARPIGLLNVNGFYEPLVRFLDQLVTERFVRVENREMLAVAAEVPELLKQMEAYQPTNVPKWISRAET